MRNKGRMDQANPKVQEWAALMWKYQQALPFAKPGEKWMLMERVFELQGKVSAETLVQIALT